MEVAGLLLDTDDVLYDDSFWLRWLCQLLGHFGARISYCRLARLWRHVYLPPVSCGQCDFEQALRKLLLACDLTAAQADEVLVAAVAKRRQTQRQQRPLPGVTATSARLRAMGVPLGILCNVFAPGEDVGAMLEQMGLGNFFQPICSSSQLGCAKPSSRSYELALEAMQLPARQVAFVGHDSWELAAARAVGMPTVAFNYDEDAVADVYLDQFGQLLERLAFRTTRRRAG